MAASEKRLVNEKERNSLQVKKNYDVRREPHIHSGLANTYDINTHVLPDLGETEFMKRKFNAVDANHRT